MLCASGSDRLLNRHDHTDVPVRFLTPNSTRCSKLTTQLALAAHRYDFIQVPPILSTLPVPKGWISHIHPQGWAYFHHPKMRVVTNDDIRMPKVLEAVETHIGTYPFSDLEDGMELLVHHDPQPNEHTLSLVVNHNFCMAGYDVKEVTSTEGMEADHGGSNIIEWSKSH